MRPRPRPRITFPPGTVKARQCRAAYLHTLTNGGRLLETYPDAFEVWPNSRGKNILDLSICTREIFQKKFCLMSKKSLIGQFGVISGPRTILF